MYAELGNSPTSSLFPSILTPSTSAITTSNVQSPSSSSPSSSPAAPLPTPPARRCRTAATLNASAAAAPLIPASSCRRTSTRTLVSRALGEPPVEEEDGEGERTREASGRDANVLERNRVEVTSSGRGRSVSFVAVDDGLSRRSNRSEIGLGFPLLVARATLEATRGSTRATLHRSMSGNTFSAGSASNNTLVHRVNVSVNASTLACGPPGSCFVSRNGTTCVSKNAINVPICG